MGAFLDWKTVALGACSVVLLLLGVLDNWRDDKIASQSSINDRQWEYIKELIERSYANKERIAGLEIRVEQLENKRR